MGGLAQVAFGAQVRVIVEGETRFSKITALPPSRSVGSSADAKALDLQQLFVAMTKELRIAVVKLADRLHNMRTLGSLAAGKQAKIAQETLQVQAAGVHCSADLASGMAGEAVHVKQPVRTSPPQTHRYMLAPASH